MNISPKNPPYAVRKKCERHFDLSEVKPIFTYGDTIFNPHDANIDDFLVAHEMTHAGQQGDHPDKWWDQYFLSKKFRFEQELQAYRVQFRVTRDMVKDRNLMARYLFAMAKDLSGEMYGKMCTQGEAIKLIKEGVV